MNDKMKNRAGRYVQQGGGYNLFIPKHLPPSPPIDMDGELWSLLSQADRALGRLDGSTEILPNPDLFVFMYVRKEAVLSSQIEGTQASLMDVLEFEADAVKRGELGDVDEVINYVAAMNYGLDQLKKLPVSLRLFRNIHARLLYGVRGGHRKPGEFRKEQNWIGPKGCTLKTATYVPPPPSEMTASLDNLEKYLHDDTPTPLLVKVGIAHSQFETIHPFIDGNGRVGRLLITFLLCERKVLNRPLLYLSYYFKKHRTEYYSRLQNVRDNGDWEGWLKFFLKGIYEVSIEATETAKKIVNLREEHRKKITDEFAGGAGNALSLLELLYWRPIISVNTAAKQTEIPYASTNRIISKFEELGILDEITGNKRNRRFSYRPYLDLFAD